MRILNSRQLANEQGNEDIITQKIQIRARRETNTIKKEPKTYTYSEKYMP